MPAKVNLTDLAEEILITPDEMCSFLDSQTGQIYHFPEELYSIAESGEDPDFMEDWEIEMIMEARRIRTNRKRYLELPGQYEMNEFEIMRRFIGELEEGENKKILEERTSGREAYKKFVHAVRELGIETNWYAYRIDEARKFTLNWCKENNIECVEEE